MSWLEAVLLGLVQGLTEFLPVSSSGHLVLGQRLLGLDTSGNIVFEVFVHFGTVLSIITVYHRRIVDLTKETFGALLRPGELRARYGQSADLRFVGYILITLVPTGIVYVLFKDSLEAAFDDPRLVCGMLLVTGLLLLLTLLRPHPDGPLSLVKAFVIGVAQSAAMIPGISRSGATICTALYQNVTPEQAANFSFLMLLPVVLGATVLKSLEIAGGDVVIGWVPLLVGTLVAYVSGVVAIRLMLDFVRRGNLQYFAYYCFAVGTVGLLLL